MHDLITSTMDQLHGTLTSYEMRIVNGRYAWREVSFKANKKTKEYQGDLSYGSNDKEAKLIRILKRYSDKYKGNFPFKCFNFGKLGHYTSKFRYKKEDNGHDNKVKNNYRRIKEEKNFKNKSF